MSCAKTATNTRKKTRRGPRTPAKRMVLEMVEDGKIIWPRDLKIAKRLLELFPNHDFWKKVKFQKKYWTMAYFLTKEGLSDIRQKLIEFNFEIPKPQAYNNEVIIGKKFGQDKEIIKKPKSKLDFLLG